VEAIISLLEWGSIAYNYTPLTCSITQVATLLQLPDTRKCVPVLSSTDMKSSLPQDSNSWNYGKCGNDVFDVQL